MSNKIAFKYHQTNSFNGGTVTIKAIGNFSNENVVLQWKRNPYYQYFCGMHEYVPTLFCDST